MITKFFAKVFPAITIVLFVAGTVLAFSLFFNEQASLDSFTFPATVFSPQRTIPATAEMIGFTLRQGEGVPFHYHEAPSFVIVAKGTLTEDDGCGNVIDHLAGSAFTEEPGHVHAVQNNGPGAVLVYYSDIYPAGSSDAIFVDGPICE
jgi:quercetin dioxygenase-like cupin family protein